VGCLGFGNMFHCGKVGCLLVLGFCFWLFDSAEFCFS